MRNDFLTSPDFYNIFLPTFIFFRELCSITMGLRPRQADTPDLRLIDVLPIYMFHMRAIYAKNKINENCLITRYRDCIAVFFLSSQKQELCVKTYQSMSQKHLDKKSIIPVSNLGQYNREYAARWTISSNLPQHKQWNLHGDVFLRSHDLLENFMYRKLIALPCAFVRGNVPEQSHVYVPYLPHA